MISPINLVLDKDTSAMARMGAMQDEADKPGNKGSNKPANKGRFRSGMSGNPLGRPKGSVDARFRCRQLDDKTLSVLEALLDDADGDLRFKAACRIRDEAWGKPVQSVQVMHEDRLILEALPDAELLAIAMGKPS